MLPDGTVVTLAVLHDDRCAILRNSETIHEAAGDADGIDGAVQRFMAMTQVSDTFSAGESGARDGARPDMTPAVDPIGVAAAAAAAAPSSTSPGTSA